MSRVRERYQCYQCRSGSVALPYISVVTKKLQVPERRIRLSEIIHQKRILVEAWHSLETNNKLLYGDVSRYSASMSRALTTVWLRT